jgi:hypothetical protein
MSSSNCESIASQPVSVTEVDERQKCGCCNYASTRFYRLGEEPPEPASDDPDERGLCSSCFAQMLAGEGIYEDTPGEFRVRRIQQGEGGESDV